MKTFCITLSIFVTSMLQAHTATMQIKVASMFQVVDAKGKRMSLQSFLVKITSSTISGSFRPVERNICKTTLSKVSMVKI